MVVHIYICGPNDWPTAVHTNRMLYYSSLMNSELICVCADIWGRNGYLITVYTKDIAKVFLIPHWWWCIVYDPFLFMFQKNIFCFPGIETASTAIYILFLVLVVIFFLLYFFASFIIFYTQPHTPTNLKQRFSQRRGRLTLFHLNILAYFNVWLYY